MAIAIRRTRWWPLIGGQVNTQNTLASRVESSLTIDLRQIWRYYIKALEGCDIEWLVPFVLSLLYVSSIALFLFSIAHNLNWNWKNVNGLFEFDLWITISTIPNNDVTDHQLINVQCCNALLQSCILYKLSWFLLSKCYIPSFFVI